MGKKKVINHPLVITIFAWWYGYHSQMGGLSL